MSLWRRLYAPVLICRTINREVLRRNINNFVNKQSYLTSQMFNLQLRNTFYESIRCKSKKKYDSDDEDVIVDDDSSLSRDSKVVKFNVTSLRTDSILKSALGVARNKIEHAFYESKIRVNGKKIMKKNATVRLGDEIDIVKTVSPKNPDHLYVSRIEILNIAPSEENISFTARRFKNLLIENYEEDPYKVVPRDVEWCNSIGRYLSRKNNPPNTTRASKLSGISLKVRCKQMKSSSFSGKITSAKQVIFPEKLDSFICLQRTLREISDNFEALVVL